MLSVKSCTVLGWVWGRSPLYRCQPSIWQITPTQEAGFVISPTAHNLANHHHPCEQQKKTKGLRKRVVEIESRMWAE
jgi:hypothetical protein